jgi:heme-degrading monooxygenase HmoA
MIVRAWRAQANNPDGYAQHFRRNVIPELKAIDGFLGASLLKQERSGDVELLVVTRWRCMDAIRAFAGEDVTRAVVEPEAVAALASYDRTVQHYEVMEDIALT